MSSIETLPPNLHPFATNHPASCAYRMHLSEHEWTWTQAEQEAIARALIRRDYELSDLNHRLALAKAAVNACHSAMLGKVNPKSPAWEAIRAFESEKS